VPGPLAGFVQGVLGRLRDWEIADHALRGYDGWEQIATTSAACVFSWILLEDSRREV
jgi:hypothetical protein